MCQEPFRPRYAHAEACGPPCSRIHWGLVTLAQSLRPKRRDDWTKVLIEAARLAWLKYRSFIDGEAAR